MAIPLTSATEDLMTGISLQLSWGNWSLFYELSPSVRQGAFLRLFESPQEALGIKTLSREQWQGVA